MEAKPVDTRKSKEHKVAKRIAQVGAIGGLTLTVLFGPGLLAGWRNARADQGRLERAEKSLPVKEKAAAEATIAFNNYTSTISKECANSLNTFLHNGRNANFSNGEAQIIIQQSNVCEGTPMDLVGQSRILDKDLQKTHNSFNNLKTKIRGLQEDAEHNYELIQGPMAGLILEVAAGIGFTILLSTI